MTAAPLADRRLGRWLDESLLLPATGLCFRRYWLVGPRYRAAVVFEDRSSDRFPDDPISWSVGSADANEQEHGRASSLDAGMRATDERLRGYLAKMDAVAAPTGSSA